MNAEAARRLEADTVGVEPSRVSLSITERLDLVLSTLSTRDRLVLSFRYGLEGGAPRPWGLTRNFPRRGLARVQKPATRAP